MTRARCRFGRTKAAALASFAALMWCALAIDSPAAVETRDDNAGAPAPQIFGDAPPPAGSAPGDNLTSANPLWAIPLQMLTATRERPIFIPSRRPPAPAVVGAPVPAPPRPVVAGPELPQLSLVGTVAGATEGIAVFVNQATRDIVRLRTGEGHDGWILRSVNGREAVLEKNQRSAVIALPAPSQEQK